MKIGVFSDLHLGVRTYGLKELEQDFYNQYMKAINKFIECEVDAVICGGDIFDKPRPSPKALKSFVEGISKLKNNDIPFYNIIGNHSMVQSNGFVTADDFLDKIGLNNYQLLDKDNIIEKDDVFIAGLPYYNNINLNEFIEFGKWLNEKAGKSKMKTKILVVHQAFKEYCGYQGEELSINELPTSNFDLLICGHIHQIKICDIDENTVYLQPGSLSRQTVAEARDEEVQGKGVFIIDTDLMITDNNVSNSFIKLKNPRPFLISDFYISSEEEIVQIKEELLNKFKEYSEKPVLFLTVHDKSSSFIQLMDLTKDMNKECLTVRLKYFDESTIATENIPSNPNDIPSPREALSLALNPLDDDEAKLGLDLYDQLSQGNDVSKLLDDFLEEYRDKKDKERKVEVYSDSELEEIKRELKL